MLHLVFKSFTDESILQRLAAGDDVVFLDNGIFALLAKGRWASAIEARLGAMQFFVLLDHLSCRGVDPADLVEGVMPIDDAGWVALTVKNKVIQSWI